MLTFAAEINQSNVILTASDKEIQDLFSRLGQLTVLPDESDFDLATVSLCMNGWFYFFAEGLQCWLAEQGMADEVARRLVLGGLKDCAEYASHNAAIALGNLGNGMASSEHLTLQGLEVLAKCRRSIPGALHQKRCYRPYGKPTRRIKAGGFWTFHEMLPITPVVFP